MGQGGCGERGRGSHFNILKGHMNTNYSWMVSLYYTALLPSLECVLLLLRYCKFHMLFYCYCATANFTIWSTATVTALLPTSQFVLLLMYYCPNANFTNLSYCATANFANLSYYAAYCAAALLLVSPTLKRISFLPGVRSKPIYTDGQKKRLLQSKWSASLVSCKVSEALHANFARARCFHDSINIPKIEFITYIYISL